jgi:hypothetical protein
MRNEGSSFLARDTAAAAPPIFSCCNFSNFFHEQARRSLLPHNLKMMWLMGAVRFDVESECELRKQNEN